MVSYSGLPCSLLRLAVLKALFAYSTWARGMLERHSRSNNAFGTCAFFYGRQSDDRRLVSPDGISLLGKPNTVNPILCGCESETLDVFVLCVETVLKHVVKCEHF